MGGTAPAWLMAPPVSHVVAAFHAAGSEVRAVGGCVRDSLLGWPVKDVDMATPVLPEAVIALAEKAGLKAVPTGIDHGTVTLIAEGGSVEVTTLREDTSCDGRHAEVAFTDDWRTDAGRRDFTMNAIFMAPDGALTDFFGGVDDVYARRVRFIGDPQDRIKEDYLRILRFFRFFAHYGAHNHKSEPDAAAVAACALLKEGLLSLSAERVQSELLKLLSAPDPSRSLEAMADTGVLDVVLPEAESLSPLVKMLQLEAEAGLDHDPVRRFAVLAGPDSGPAAARLKFSNHARQRVIEANDTPVSGDVFKSQSACRIALYRLGSERVIDVLAVAASQGRLTPPADAFRRVVQAADTWVRPEFPIRGSDVLDLGVSPGPRVGDVLKTLEDWWCINDFAPGRAELVSELMRLVDQES